MSLRFSRGVKLWVRVGLVEEFRCRRRGICYLALYDDSGYGSYCADGNEERSNDEGYAKSDDEAKGYESKGGGTKDPNEEDADEEKDKEGEDAYKKNEEANEENDAYSKEIGDEGSER